MKCYLGNKKYKREADMKFHQTYKSPNEHIYFLTSRGTLRQKHVDAFARIRGFLFLKYGCSLGNKRTGETQLVIATKALSAASHTKRLSCEDLRRSCTSCMHHIEKTSKN